MNRYERYKDSGIPWLGKVPEHWEVKRLRFTVNLNPVKSELDIPEDTLVSFIPMEAVNFDKNLTLTEERNLDEVYKGYTYFKNGDVVLAKITPCFENGKSAIAQNLTNGIAFGTTELHVLRSQDSINNHFLYYLIKSDSFMKIGESEMYGAGGQKRVPEEFIKNFLIGLPPYYEQTAIAHYLDTKLGEINALIDKQQTLLEKLAEQRTAVITHAVTKGLNPAAPMKNSGVEWLGDVPAHWETWKITHAIDLIGSGTTPKSDNAEYYDGDILWVTTSELRENFISDTKQKVSDSAIKEYSALKIYPVNSVAMAMYGATIGRLGILEREATFNQACCVFGNSKILHYKFLFYWLWHRRPILISLSNGGGQPNLSQDDLRKLKIPIPSYEEQINIAEYLDQETVKIDRLCETINQTIGRLKEYRTTLITQAVTGKIKVTDE